MVKAVQLDPGRICQWRNDNRRVQRAVLEADDLTCRSRLAQF